MAPVQGNPAATPDPNPIHERLIASGQAEPRRTNQGQVDVRDQEAIPTEVCENHVDLRDQHQ